MRHEPISKLPDQYHHGGQLHKAKKVMRVRTGRQRQTVPIHYGHDSDAFYSLRLAYPRTVLFGQGEHPVNEALPLVHGLFLAQIVGQAHQQIARGAVRAPLLKPTVHCFVVRIALWQHLPLRARVEDPQDAFENLSYRHRLATGPPRRDVFYREVFAYAFPLLVAQSYHDHRQCFNFETGSCKSNPTLP